jgi:hypothetical protein
MPSMKTCMCTRDQLPLPPRLPAHCPPDLGLGLHQLCSIRLVLQLLLLYLLLHLLLLLLLLLELQGGRL